MLDHVHDVRLDQFRIDVRQPLQQRLLGLLGLSMVLPGLSLVFLGLSLVLLGLILVLIGLSLVLSGLSFVILTRA